MNVHKQISRLKHLFRKIATRLQPLTHPIKKLAWYTWVALYPPVDEAGNPVMDKATLEKSIFALSLICVMWVAALCFQVNFSSKPQSSATLVPDLSLNAWPESQKIDIGANLQQMVLEVLSSQKVAEENPLEQRKQVLEFMESLESKPDASLNTRELIDKYNSLCLSSILLSKLSRSPGKQRLWSSIAINHSEKALAALPKSKLTTVQFQEINLNRFLAMALNYYQRGPVSAQQLKEVFRSLDKQYLMNSGYHQSSLLQVLAEDGIIALPSYTHLKNS